MCSLLGGERTLLDRVYKDNAKLTVTQYYSDFVRIMLPFLNPKMFKMTGSDFLNPICLPNESALLLAIHLVSGYGAPWSDHSILEKANLGPLDTLDFYNIQQIQDTLNNLLTKVTIKVILLVQGTEKGLLLNHYFHEVHTITLLYLDGQQYYLT